MTKRNIQHTTRLIIAAIALGAICATMIFLFKEATEFVEMMLFTRSKSHLILSLLFPIIGLSIIYFLRIYLFQKKENKGIREINQGLHLKNPQIPLYKIPSHLLNGFFTIILGGSTGIEVSSVVASSAVGSAINNKLSILKKYRAELICAGAAAAVAALFNSPIGGLFFAYEVMYKRFSKHFAILTCVSVISASIINFFIHQPPLFGVGIQEWHTYAIPYFILLGIIAGLHSVYLTRIVIYLKKFYSRNSKKYAGIFTGALVIGIIVYFFPALYGEGYHAMKGLLDSGNNLTLTSTLLIQLLFIMALKPIITSLTLAAGGDGGVFAPSLFMGAFLGLFVALVLNTHLQAAVIPLNFMVVGMASVLCASIQAPLTSIFLVCGITGNYVLLIPLSIGCAMSRITAHIVYPYSVYNYPIK